MTMPEEIGAGLRKGVRPAMRKSKLVAESGADGDTLAARGAAAAENGGAALGLHARPEAVSLYAAVAVGLKRALGHGIAPASTSEIVAVTASFKYIAGEELNPASTRLSAAAGFAATRSALSDSKPIRVCERRAMEDFGNLFPAVSPALVQ
jgi:hypothetical protein